MKLSNEQINAILDVYEKRYKKEMNTKVEKQIAENKKQIMEQAKKYYKVLCQIPPQVRRVIRMDRTLAEIAYSLQSELPSVNGKFDRNEMRGKIILATIETETIDELKKKLKIEF